MLANVAAMAGLPDSVRAVEHLLYAYAERIDAGDFAGVAELFTHGRIEPGPDLVIEGPDAVRHLYETTTRRYDDGTPTTKHVTTNTVIEVDETDGTASSRSSFTVTQATDESCHCRSSSPAGTTTPSTGSRTPGGSTPGSCSSIRSATCATTC